jgi:hypothetical protein
MIDFFFFLKTLALALLVVVFTQIKVGDQSVESHMHRWIKSSSVTAPLNRVAQGAAKFVRDTSAKVTRSLQGKDGKEGEEKKASSFRWSI